MIHPTPLPPLDILQKYFLCESINSDGALSTLVMNHKIN